MKAYLKNTGWLWLMVSLQGLYFLWVSYGWQLSKDFEHQVILDTHRKMLAVQKHVKEQIEWGFICPGIGDCAGKCTTIDTCKSVVDCWITLLNEGYLITLGRTHQRYITK